MWKSLFLEWVKISLCNPESSELLYILLCQRQREKLAIFQCYISIEIVERCWYWKWGYYTFPWKFVSRDLMLTQQNPFKKQIFKNVIHHTCFTQEQPFSFSRVVPFSQGYFAVGKWKKEDRQGHTPDQMAQPNHGRDWGHCPSTHTHIWRPLFPLFLLLVLISKLMPWIFAYSGE